MQSNRVNLTTEKLCRHCAIFTLHSARYELMRRAMIVFRKKFLFRGKNDPKLRKAKSLRKQQQRFLKNEQFVPPSDTFHNRIDKLRAEFLNVFLFHFRACQLFPENIKKG